MKKAEKSESPVKTNGPLTNKQITDISSNVGRVIDQTIAPRVNPANGSSTPGMLVASLAQLKLLTREQLVSRLGEDVVASYEALFTSLADSLTNPFVD